MNKPHKFSVLAIVILLILLFVSVSVAAASPATNQALVTKPTATLKPSATLKPTQTASPTKVPPTATKVPATPTKAPTATKISTPTKVVQPTATAGPGSFTMAQTLSDGAQLDTLSFDGFGFITGSLGADSFFPPGKVADFWGFQYLRDNDPEGMGHNTD